MQQNDQSWIIWGKQGDADAFVHLVEMYQRPVFNLCYRMLANAEDAEDAAQETFLRAYRSLRSYDESRPFLTWLLSIAAHHCIDKIRKLRIHSVSIDGPADLELTDGAPGPEAMLSKAEEAQRVRLLLDVLTPLDRAIVVMYYWYDLSYDEISEALGLTVSAVKSRLHRARKDMAEAWMHPSAHSQPVGRSRHGEQSPAF